MKVLLDPGAFMPEYAHAQDAGADLRSPVCVTVPAGETVQLADIIKEADDD